MWNISGDILLSKASKTHFMNTFNENTLFYQVGSLAALHLAKRGHDIHLYEYREGNLFDVEFACIDVHWTSLFEIC